MQRPHVKRERKLVVRLFRNMERYKVKPWKVKYKAIVKKFKQDYIEVKLKHIGYDLWSLNEPVWPY